VSLSFVELGQIADINPRLPKDTDETQKVSFLTMAAVSENGEILSQEERILSETKKGFTYFERDDVLLAKITPCFENGKAVLVDKLNHQIGFGSTEFHVLRPYDDALDARYLFYMVWNDRFRFLGQSAMKGAAGQKRVSADFLKEFRIPLPPLAEQKRIAAILDKADSLRRKRQQAIQLADQFLRAVFLDMFGDPVANPKGWDEIVLKEIADIRSGVTKGKKVDSSNSVTLPYMRVANVQDGYLDLSDIQKISVSLNDAEKYQLKMGDILLTEGGDPDKLGRGYVWNNEIENCIHQNHIFSVRINDKNKIRPAFLSAVIASQRGKRYFLKVGKQTTGIATINKTVLSEFKPFIPPVEVQDKFIAAVNKLNRSKQLFSKGDLNLFNSLSQKAFVGEL
jgi:type I restriction enzyme S subunit